MRWEKFRVIILEKKNSYLRKIIYKFNMYTYKKLFSNLSNFIFLQNSIAILSRLDSIKLLRQ